MESNAGTRAAAVEAGRRLGTEEQDPDDSVDSATVGLVRSRVEAGRGCSRISYRGSKRGRWEGGQDAADEKG